MCFIIIHSVVHSYDTISLFVSFMSICFRPHPFSIIPINPPPQAASKASDLTAADRDRVYRALKRSVSDAVKNELCALLGMAAAEPKKKQRAVQMLFQPGARRCPVVIVPELCNTSNHH